MFAVIQFRQGKFEGQWIDITSIVDARGILAAMKIGGKGCIFSIEKDGVIIEVVNRTNE